MRTNCNVIELAGRLLIAWLFLHAGLDKITGYAGVQAHMVSAGVPGALLPLVIVLEVLGAVAIIVGYRTRLVAAALAVFSVVSALLFHASSDPMQQLMLYKNLAIAGGFLFLVVHGAGRWSIDARRERLASPRDPIALEH
jgi:putative oxidoreductase